MGQRSQIYVKVQNENENYLVARYFQWNYGERMVSRARGIVEWLKAHGEYITYELKELERICDVNFDYHDIVLSHDIIKEYKDGFCSKRGVFVEQDNNDGKLYIDVLIQESKKNNVVIKYCLTDDENNYLGNAEQYLNWNVEYDRNGNWRKNFENSQYHPKSDIKMCERNIKYLDKKAKLMSPSELNNFIEYSVVHCI